MHIAVITEYNPFHLGHEYQISELRKAFPTACITAVMGGIFSQRGTPYITTPYVRAEAAVLCGCDLVLELPFPFSCAPARIFARAGVEIAEKIGADMLAFGSECGDIPTLEKTLARLESDGMKNAVLASDDGSISKSRLYFAAYKELYGEDGPSLPNDILAIEYLRAIKSRGGKIKPYTIKRIGDYKKATDGFMPASVLRAEYERNGLSALKGKIPEKAYEIYAKAESEHLFGADFEKLCGAVMLEFTKDKTDIAFSGGGLYNHIQKNAFTADKIDDLLHSCASARFTHSEIMRCILYTLLNVHSEQLDAPVFYTKMFAASDKGRKVLNESHEIEIITKPSAVEKLSDKAKAQYMATFFAERAFALCLGSDYEHLKQTPKVKP